MSLPRYCMQCVHRNVPTSARPCADCFGTEGKHSFMPLSCDSPNDIAGSRFTSPHPSGAVRAMREAMNAAPAKPASATQVGGDHYRKLPIQPFQYSMANKLDPMQHTVIKYVTRFRDKGGLESLRKARHTIDLLIEHEYGANAAQ